VATNLGSRNPADCGFHAIELQQQDPESSLALVTKALEQRRLL
jgi:alpha-glucosidase